MECCKVVFKVSTSNQSDHGFQQTDSFEIELTRLRGTVSKLFVTILDSVSSSMYCRNQCVDLDIVWKSAAVVFCETAQSCLSVQCWGCYSHAVLRFIAWNTVATFGCNLSGTILYPSVPCYRRESLNARISNRGIKEWWWMCRVRWTSECWRLLCANASAAYRRPLLCQLMEVKVSRWWCTMIDSPLWVDEVFIVSVLFKSKLIARVL